METLTGDATTLSRLFWVFESTSGNGPLLVADKFEYFELLLILSFAKLMNSHSYLELKHMFFLAFADFSISGFFYINIPKYFLPQKKNPQYFISPIDLWGDSHKRTTLVVVRHFSTNCLLCDTIWSLKILQSIILHCSYIIGGSFRWSCFQWSGWNQWWRDTFKYRCRMNGPFLAIYSFCYFIIWRPLFRADNWCLIFLHIKQTSIRNKN